MSFFSPRTFLIRPLILLSTSLSQVKKQTNVKCQRYYLAWNVTVTASYLQQCPFSNGTQLMGHGFTFFVVQSFKTEQAPCGASLTSGVNSDSLPVW